jgi:hypothetical protein
MRTPVKKPEPLHALLSPVVGRSTRSIGSIALELGEKLNELEWCECMTSKHDWRDMPG